MGNTFGAHIFKRRSVGEREEVTIKLFTMDGDPLEIGEAPETPDLSTAVLSAWKGTYDGGLDYEAGSLVRHNGATYLALVDAPNTALDPGEVVAITRAAYYKNGERNTYVLPHDVEVTIADLDAQGGYNYGGQSGWFKIVGTPGELVTCIALNTPGTPLAFYDHDDPAVDNTVFASPKTVAVPADGSFYMEVSAAASTFKWVGPNGPQPVATNPWALFG